MIVRSKRNDKGNIKKILSGGEIKEITIKEDLFDKDKTKIEVCYMGMKSSGIIEFEKKEIEEIYKKVSGELRRIPKARIVKFKK